MTPEFDPTPEQQNVVLADAVTLRKAEQLIESCEHCNPDGAEIPFDNILDEVTRSDPKVTDYILESRDVRIAVVRFWKRLSLSLCNGPVSQSSFPLVRRLLEVGVRLVTLC